MNLFLGGQWHICMRAKVNQSDKRIAGRNKPFAMIDNPPGGWLADPFLFEHNTITYLFFERFINKQEKGVIGCARVDDNGISPLTEVINEPFHLSYPFVFDWDGDVYMIPESSQGGKIGLYRAIDFPCQWRYESTILEGEHCADTTIVSQENGILELITYLKQTNKFQTMRIVYSLSDRKIHSVECITSEHDYCRPGGKPIQFGNDIFLPIQDCRKKYGESLGFFPMSGNDRRINFERPSFKLSVSDILIEGFSGQVQRLHTYNSTSKYEVIDVFEEQFDFWHSAKMLRRRIRQARLA